MNYRKVRFEYYEVVYKKTKDRLRGKDRLFDLVKFMDKAKKKSLEGRTYDYRSERARLEEAYWDVDLNFYFLHFLRLRDTNIPSKAKTNKSVEPMELADDEYIGEEVSALYDEDNHILMLQRNKHSLGPEGIEEYLNLLWNSDNEKIYLRPICPPNVIRLAQNASEYRKINIRLANIGEEETKSALSKLKSPLKNIVNAFGQYEGVNAQVVITVGNSNDGLNNETIQDTLVDLRDNGELFNKAEIALRDEDDTRVELIDLFNHKAHDIASFRMEKRETLNHYSIVSQMHKFYSSDEDCDNRQKVIKGYLRNKTK
ncbi:hypothetical protein MM326_15310 [Alkalihalobacillus sp. LMS6]|jgi:hypothetical protein|uniref:DUF6731 family protein n=1 Tax=Alkalihalobacillus sp. LMS6 TaxID=2924034 RepID=UPI0020D12997|nr:DUF6731 family protein [Alkalihalobacillus sp. LMS6]UTR05465.1 hypothetical protein MM326_15310 [Alkalihalobacillus sp. LMS6]